MTALRHLAHSRHRLALALVVCALALRLLVPAGFMPDVKHFGIVICTGHGPVATTISVAHDKSTPPDSHKPDQPCGFGGAVVGLLASIDPVVLAAAIAFIVALGITSEALPARLPAGLRPPLRGPPALRQV